MLLAAPDATTSDAASASATPDAAVSGGVPTDLGSMTPTPSPTSEAPVAAAEEIKQAVGAKSETLSDVLNTLDKMSVSAGSMRISLLDVLVVAGGMVAIYLVAWLAIRASKAALRRMTKLDPSQSLLAEKLVSLFVWGVAILFGVDMLGIDLTAFAVFSGAFGLAIGFGLQKTFGNLIAGIILLMDRSIKPGDVIAIADQSGATTFGQIRKIGIRAVSVTTRDEREYLIPNENLMINQVENWSYSSKNVRIQVHVGVSYNCDIKRAEELMLEAAKSVPRVLKTPPPTVWLDQYGASSVDFIIHCWIRDPEEGVGNIRSAVLKKLWDLLHEEGIEIPFPQTDLNLRRNDEFDQLVAAIAQRVSGSDNRGD
ncbi:MAG: mechanosensitive ion channel [Sphingomonadales bacterium]|nr:mechanosensitive ion channel [Sphingomonadales bacterium]MBD3774848.1 mechanosensitive ion channel [Paracoccaceae bacterium]